MTTTTEMTNEEIQAEVIRLIATELGWWRNAPKVELDDTFEKLKADSLDRLSLSMNFEEEFNIEIGDDEAMGVVTVRDAVDLVTRKVGEKG